MDILVAQPPVGYTFDIISTFDTASQPAFRLILSNGSVIHGDYFYNEDQIFNLSVRLVAEVEADQFSAAVASDDITFTYLTEEV